MKNSHHPNTSPNTPPQKNQGHYFDVAAASYSPDGALLATGADDSKVGCHVPLLEAGSVLGMADPFQESGP